MGIAKKLSQVINYLIHESIETTRSYRIVTVVSALIYFTLNLSILSYYVNSTSSEYVNLTSAAFIETVIFFCFVHILVRPILRFTIFIKGMSVGWICFCVLYLMVLGVIHFSLLLSIDKVLIDHTLNSEMHNVEVHAFLNSSEILLFGGVQSFLFFLIWAFGYSVTILLLHQRNIQKAMTEAQVGLLLNQISPHFLFNTLNSIRALMYENLDAAAESITKLSQLLRTQTLSQQSIYSSFHDELEVCKAYLDLCKIRYEDRLFVEYTCEGDLHAWQLPTLTLSTLVENAIKHGIDCAEKAGNIKISIDCRDENKGVIKVENSIGGTTDAVSTYVGLKNVKKRLHLMPTKASISFVQTVNEYRVEIVVGNN